MRFLHQQQPELFFMVYRPLARTYDRLGNRQKQYENFEQHVKQHPDSMDVHYDFARFLVQFGDYEKAKFHFEKACTYAPEYRRSEIWMHYAVLRMFLFGGESEKSVSQLLLIFNPLKVSGLIFQ